MALLETTRTFPFIPDDLTQVARDVMEQFRKQRYEVTGEPTSTGGWHISISKGDVFKAVLGLRTALNLQIEPASFGLTARVSVGLFGLQAIPTAIAMLVFWPIMLTQIWGITQQMQLDEEVLNTVQRCILAGGYRTPFGATSQGGRPASSPSPTSRPANQAGTSGASATPGSFARLNRFCSHCGIPLQAGDRFCSGCGAKVG